MKWFRILAVMRLYSAARRALCLFEGGGWRAELCVTWRTRTGAMLAQHVVSDEGADHPALRGLRPLGPWTGA